MLLTLVLLVVLLGVVVAILYNRLVRDRNRASAAWSDIDVQLQRRHDLIPQLVKAIDQYARYERATLEAVTSLRAAAMSASAVEERGTAEEALNQGLSQVLALAEQYPQLKADKNFLNLQEELVETENYLQFARRFYNGSVREYNTRRETVPNNFVASMFGFSEQEYFQKESDDVTVVPRVGFGSDE